MLDDNAIDEIIDFQRLTAGIC